jgi:hypothetical protein
MCYATHSSIQQCIKEGKRYKWVLIDIYSALITWIYLGYSTVSTDYLLKCFNVH